jgi:hypothetical protein
VLLYLYYAVRVPIDSCDEPSVDASWACKHSLNRCENGRITETLLRERHADVNVRRLDYFEFGRIMNRGQARTASTNLAPRLLLVGLALLLINLWVHFKQLYACDPIVLADGRTCAGDIVAADAPLDLRD